MKISGTHWSSPREVDLAFYLNRTKVFYSTRFDKRIVGCVATFDGVMSQKPNPNFWIFDLTSVDNDTLNVINTYLLKKKL